MERVALVQSGSKWVGLRSFILKMMDELIRWQKTVPILLDEVITLIHSGYNGEEKKSQSLSLAGRKAIQVDIHIFSWKTTVGKRFVSIILTAFFTRRKRLFGSK